MADDVGRASDAITRFAPGELLAGRFRIVRELAHGGMGVVYEARDEKLERRIALKAARAGHARLLSPEVRNASTVSHPNVCRIYELHTAGAPAGDIDFITMEFVEGETLAARLERAAIPEREARTIALQLCAGLSEAHRSQVIHGDLKPQNIVLGHDSEGRMRAVIMDFGLARGAQGEVISGGTRGYMAPELAGGAPSSVASDLYALGVILHELFAEREKIACVSEADSTIAVTPGQSPTAATSSAQSARSRPLHARFEPIVRRCLADDPSHRFASVAELARALDPPRGRGRVVATAIVAIAITVGSAYWRVNTPASTVKLAVDSAVPIVPMEQALGALKGTRTQGFRLVRNAKQASHFLRVESAGSAGARRVVVELRVAGATAALAHWEASYAPDEAAFIPAGVAGVVSAALRLTPDPARTHIGDPAALSAYQTGLSLLRHDDRLDSAMVLLERAAKAAPASPLPWAALAEAQWRQYFLTDATDWATRCRESVRSAERRGQDTPEVHRIAGLLELNDGRTAEAIARYRRATELPSTNADAWRRLGEAYRLDNQPQLALAALQRAVAVEPLYSRTHQDLGSWHFARGDYRAAIPELEQAVRLAPQANRPRSVLASAFMNVGRFGDAERTLRTGLERAEDATMLLALGQTLMYQSRDAEAIPLLQRAAAMDSSEILAPLYLGNCLYAAGRKAEARAAHLRSFEITQQRVMRAPQFGYYRGFLAYLCARLEDPARAVAEIEQARRSAPEAADVRWAAALTYEKLSQRDAAIEVLESAPLAQLEDLARWPEAAALVRDARFQQLLHAAPRTP